MYSSRTRKKTDMFERLQRWKKRAYQALLKVPEDRLTDEERAMRDKLAKLPEITIVQLIYQQKSYEGERQGLRILRHLHARTLAERLLDTQRTLLRKDWLAMPWPGTGILSHDVHRDYEG